MENKKWKFGDLVITPVGWIGFMLSFGIFYLAQDGFETIYANYNGFIGIGFAIVFLIMYSFAVIRTHNKIVEKNIKDKKAEDTGEYNSYKGWE